MRLQADRRNFLHSVLAIGVTTLLWPLRALAVVWNSAAFAHGSKEEALAGLKIAESVPSPDIVIVAPDFAENGAVVQIEVSSRIANTEAIALLVDKNPVPLIANFMFGQGTKPAVIVRIKIAETSTLEAIAKVGDHYYSASKQIEVSLSGC